MFFGLIVVVLDAVVPVGDHARAGRCPVSRARCSSFAYVGGLGGFAGLLLASNDGIGLILGVALCVIAYDVVGFFVGSQFGHTPIAPKVSPNKIVRRHASRA